VMTATLDDVSKKIKKKPTPAETNDNHTVKRSARVDQSPQQISPRVNTLTGHTRAPNICFAVEGRYEARVAQISESVSGGKSVEPLMNISREGQGRSRSR
jgi:hypothetical protein